MLIKAVSALAALAVAGVHASEPMPYQPLVKMSVNQMFGLSRRQADDGYQPTDSQCGAGNTCAEACGTGFEACTSHDDTVHCYDKQAKQTCCPDNSGNSCDAGFYCSADDSHATWCCPDSMDLETCASAFNVTGALVSEIPKPTSTPAPTSTSAVTPSSTPAENTTTPASVETATPTPYSTFSSVGTISPSSTYPQANATTGLSGTPSPTQIGVSGAAVTGPVGILALIAAVGVAALL